MSCINCISLTLNLWLAMRDMRITHSMMSTWPPFARMKYPSSKRCQCSATLHEFLNIQILRACDGIFMMCCSHFLKCMANPARYENTWHVLVAESGAELVLPAGICLWKLVLVMLLWRYYIFLIVFTCVNSISALIPVTPLQTFQNRHLQTMKHAGHETEAVPGSHWWAMGPAQPGMPTSAF